MSGQTTTSWVLTYGERNVHRAPVGSGRLAENSAVILHGIAVVRVVRVRLKNINATWQKKVFLQRGQL